MVDRKEILSSLKRMGIREGDVLLVHSSLTAAGYVEGGAEAMIDALLEAAEVGHGCHVHVDRLE